jgi:hypothetical protein
MATNIHSIGLPNSGGAYMQATTQAGTVSKGQFWAGVVVSALPILFLLMDAVMKFVKPAIVVETTVKLGYPASTITPIGVALLISTLLYIFPKTSVLGAILVTGYLGGAVATHVRVNEGVFSIVFPVIIGVLVWLGLYLRDARLQTLVPVRK